MEKPGLPSGTRDFGPEVMLRRKYLMGVIEEKFRLYGFRPIETPALENLRTLQGKYGDEGDQLLFKILNNGDFLAKADEEILKAKDSKNLVTAIADRGLRYDLTVPLARFVVMNRDKLTFPFKRYQMQAVWRADRPQKGRYREFWQCDADVVGSASVINEIDLIKIYDSVFVDLNLPVKIKINHRGIFDAFIDFVGSPDIMMQLMQIIDKADKIGVDGVKAEIASKNIENGVLFWDTISQAANEKNPLKKLDILSKTKGVNGTIFQNAQKDLELIFSLASTNNILELDLSLARGLSYYTGCIFEVVPEKSESLQGFHVGSIGGGGRYDNLTGVFGLKGVAGVGISFGLDRIYDTLEAANLFPEITNSDVRILICPMDNNAMKMAFALVNLLRDANIAAEIYPGPAKLSKQLDYANDRKINYAAIIGENEIKNNEIALKNMITGEQKVYPMTEVSNHLHLWQF
jgi:histidyl-tRNA synthetase